MDDEHKHCDDEGCDCCGCSSDDELQTIMLDVDGTNVEFAIMASFEYLEKEYLALTPLEGEMETILFLSNDDVQNEQSEWVIVEDNEEVSSLYEHILSLMDEDEFDDDLDDIFEQSDDEE